MKILQLIKKSIFVFLLLLTGYTTFAQSLAMPAHSSIYTGFARGYWFTAPVSFTITGLRVPTDAGTGPQYIQVMKLNTTPPIAFTAQSSNFTNLFYISGATSGTIVPASISVNAGDVIGILGATGGTGQSCSYHNGTIYSTLLAGFPVTLARFGYQGSINTGAAPLYWGEASTTAGQIGRVEMYYSVGPPCPGTTGRIINNVTSTAATFSWNAVSGSVGYDYVVKTGATPPVAGIINTTATTASITGLTPSTLYYLFVRNKCSAFNNSSWDTLSFITNPPCSVPSGFAANNVDSNSALISWTPVTSATSGYQYIVKKTKSLPTSATGSTNTALNSVQLTGLDNGTVYYVFVRSKCAGNDSSGWSLDSFYTPIPCRRPVLALGHLSSNNSVVYWSPVQTAIGYEYYLGPVTTIPANGTPIVTPSIQTPYLQPSTSYTMNVRCMCNDRGVKTSSQWSSLDSTSEPPLSVGNVTNNKLALDIFPNPVKNSMTIKLNSIINGKASIIIKDQKGAVVKTHTIEQTTTTVDVTGLAAGIYILQYADAENNFTTKFTKE